MAVAYEQTYGRYGTRESGYGEYYINPEHSQMGYTDHITRTARHIIKGLGAAGDIGISAYSRMSNDVNTGFLYGYDVGTTLYEMSTGKRGTVGNYMSGALSGGVMWAWNKTLEDQKDGKTTIGNLLGLNDARRSKLGFVTKTLGGVQLATSLAKATASFFGDMRRYNRENQRRASYIDGENFIDSLRRVNSPSVLNQQEMANYAAIAKTVSAQLSYTQNPAVGYWNRMK